jgi:transposase
MSKRKRRKFTPEQKAEAVRIYRESGKSIKHVARELDLTATSLRDWVKRADEAERARDPQGALTKEERAELVELRKELHRTRMERDFLKKAAAFFAKENS